jgi:hypothetical protein
MKRNHVKQGLPVQDIYCAVKLCQAHHTLVVLWTQHTKLKVDEVTLDNLFAALQIILASSVMSSIQQNVLGLHVR